MAQTATNKQTGEKVILINGQWQPYDEDDFQRWYGTVSREMDLDTDPDSPEHKYDYRSAYASGFNPLESKDLHWPSEFKAPDHPDRYKIHNDYIEDTISGQQAKTATNPETKETVYFNEGTNKWESFEFPKIEFGKTIVEGAKDVFRNAVNFLKEADANSWRTIYGDNIEAAKARHDEEVRKDVLMQQVDAQWLKPDGTLKRPEGMKGYVQDIFRMIPQMGAQIGVTAVGGPIAGSTFMGTQIAGGAVQELKEKGVDPERAWKAAMADAFMQAPLEQIGISRALKWWNPSKEAMSAIKSFIGGGSKEFLTEWAQKYPELAAKVWAAGEGKSIDEMLNDFTIGFGEATKEGIYEGLVAAPFGAFGGAGGALFRKGQNTINKEDILNDLVGNKIRIDELNEFKKTVSPENATIIDEAISDFEQGRPNAPEIKTGPIQEVETVKGIFPQQTAEEQAAMEQDIRQQRAAKPEQFREPTREPKQVFPYPPQQAAQQQINDEWSEYEAAERAVTEARLKLARKQYGVEPKTGVVPGQEVNLAQQAKELNIAQPPTTQALPEGQGFDLKGTPYTPSQLPAKPTEMLYQKEQGEPQKAEKREPEKSMGEVAEKVSPEKAEKKPWALTKSEFAKIETNQTDDNKVEVKEATISQIKSDDIRNAIDSQEYGVDEYEVYGLRVMSKTPGGESVRVDVGDTLDDSYSWPDGEPSDEILRGASAVNVDVDNIDDAIKKLNDYTSYNEYEQIVLVGGNDYGWGNDAYNDEILIRDGKVIKIWEYNETGSSEFDLFKTLKNEAPKSLQGENPVKNSVVNEVVYHGTQGDVMELDPGFSQDVGMHFGTKQQAETFIKYGGKLFEVYLDIRNPLELDFDPTILPQDDTILINDYFQSILEKISAEFGVYDIYEPIRNKDKLFTEVLNAAENADKEAAQYVDYGDTRELYQNETIKRFWELLENVIKAKGFDGVIYNNELEGPGKSYIIFEKEQIVKSVPTQQPSSLGRVGALAKTLKDETGSSQLADDILRKAADLIIEGIDSLKKFTFRMKQWANKKTKDLWDKIKSHIADIWEAVWKSRPSLREERGSIPIEGKRRIKKIPPKEGMTKERRAELMKRYLKKTPAEIKERREKAKKTTKTGQPIERVGSVNLARQEASEMAKDLQAAVAKEKNTISWEETQEMADRKKRTSRTLKSAYKRMQNIAGGKLSSDMVALRDINVVVATKMEQTLADAMDGKISDKEMHKKLAAFEDTVNTTGEASSEIGRALNAHKIMVSPNRIYKAYQQIKGKANKRQLELIHGATRKLLDGTLTSQEMKRIETEIPDPKISEYLMEYWYNCILSGPPTHLVNIISNTGWSMFQVPHRMLISGVDKIYTTLTGKERTRYLNETIPMLAGYKKGFKKGRKAAGAMFKRGEVSEFEDKWTQEIGYFKSAFERSPNKILRKIAPIITAPTKALRAMDVWTNSMAYEGALGSLARRQANKEGLKGDKLKARTDEILTQWTEKIPNEIHEEALKKAQYATFTDSPDKITQHIIAIRNVKGIGPLIRLIIPFVNTISNLTKRGVEMTPIMGIGKEYVSRKMGRGQTTPEVIAKQIEGAIISMVILSLCAGGRITGPIPDKKNEREAWYRQGKKPWAIKIGDTWYEYRRIEPFNTVIAMAASLYDKILNAPEDKTLTEKFAEFVGQVKWNLLDGSYFAGLQSIFNRHGKRKAMVPRFAASWVPFSSFFRSINRATEVALEGSAKPREGSKVGPIPKEWAQAFSQVIPGLSGKMPAKLTLWGDEAVIPGGIFRQWLPYRWAEQIDDPVEKALEEGGYYPGLPSRKITINGVKIELDEKLYREYAINFGAALKQQFKETINSKSWLKKTKDEKYASLKKDRHKIGYRIRRQLIAKIKKKQRLTAKK